QLRQRLLKRRRHPLPAKGRDPSRLGRHAVDRPKHCWRCVMAVAAPPITLNKDEILRYSRHLILPEVGMEGQLKLKNAKVLMVGAGGLGAPLGLYLAASGVGRVGIVDFDVVDYTNLQRQVIHGTK